MLRSLFYKLQEISGYQVYKKSHLPYGVDWLWDVERTYQKNNLAQPKLFLDVGANLGQTSLAISGRFQDSSIYAFEPVPEIYSGLKEAVNSTPNIIANNVAVSDEAGTVTFLHNTSFGMKSRIADADDKQKGFNKINIEAIAIDDFLEQHCIKHVNVLKTDTEGHDISVLNGARNSIANNNIDFIFSECSFKHNHEHITKFHELRDFLSQFPAFEPFGFYDYWHRDNQAILFLNVLFVNTKRFGSA